MARRTRILRKRQEIPQVIIPAAYVTTRIMATSPTAPKCRFRSCPQDLVLDGSAPLFAIRLRILWHGDAGGV